jgi:hypothetical protein
LRLTFCRMGFFTSGVVGLADLAPFTPETAPRTCLGTARRTAKRAAKAAKTADTTWLTYRDAVEVILEAMSLIVRLAPPHTCIPCTSRITTEVVVCLTDNRRYHFTGPKVPANPQRLLTIFVSALRLRSIGQSMHPRGLSAAKQIANVCKPTKLRPPFAVGFQGDRLILREPITI